MASIGSRRRNAAAVRRRRKRHDVIDIARLSGHVSVRSIMLTVMGVLAVIYTLYFARELLMPIALAILLSFVLMPVVRLMQRKLRVPKVIGAFLVLLGLAALVGIGFYYLTGPAMGWLERLPESIARIEYKLRQFREPVEKLQDAAAQVERATTAEGRAGIEVEMKEGPSPLEQVFRGARGLVAALLFVAAYLFFLLAFGDTFLLKLVRVIPRFSDKKKAVAIVHEIQEETAHYAVTITAINAGMGVGVGAALFAIGVPNAALWGVMATLLNYVPYLGAVVGIAIVAMVSLLTFDSAGYALLAPLSYLTLTSIEANFVTPMILGNRLLLNPVVVFACVIFWGWLWGIPGALIAVPITVAMRIALERIEQLRPAAEFLGR